VRHVRCAMLLVAAWVAAAPSAHGAAQLCTSVAAIQFGNVAVSTSANAAIDVSNCGDAPLTFTDVAVHPATAPAFHVSTTCATGLALEPGAHCGASVTFAPTAPGQVSGGLYLDNAAGDDLLTFYGRGVDTQAGTATLVFTPPAVHFGEVAYGMPGPAVPLTIANAGAAPMTLTALVLNGPDAYDFAGDENSCTVGTVVAPGGSCLITLHFTPQALGPRVAELVVDSPQIASLAVLAIDGVGVTASPPSRISVVEYYNAAMDHYFLTPLASEIAICDAGEAPCAGWSRTGYAIAAYPAPSATDGAIAVCRFFNDSFAPRSSHFYALHGLGCEATLADFPDWRLESDALFAMQVPDANGDCPAGSAPVYRLYNDGKGGAPDHRYTTDLAVRATMLEQGWVAEGYGIGVAMCAPQ
jgi:Abnormal spindle-like microcephaly-assoc'd, ASPM-SPD-2-Hydin/Repeat of unknown function (DUF5648)